MAWVHRLFRKGDGVVLLAGVSLMLGLASLLMNKFMFQPVRGGYDETLDGYVDIGTNGVSIAARLKGDVTIGKVVLYCHGNAEDMTAIDGRFHGLVEKGCAVATFDYPGYGLFGRFADGKGVLSECAPALRLADAGKRCRGGKPDCRWLFHRHGRGNRTCRDAKGRGIVAGGALPLRAAHCHTREDPAD